MELPKVQFVGAPCGQHGPYTFYKAFKYFSEEKCRILSLGEFFFVKIFADAPVSIGELQLLWEDRNNSQLLSSVRLYFLPKYTPEGIQPHHGEDEVLAVSEKLILKLNDLVTLIKYDVVWTAGHSAICDSDVHCDNSDMELTQSFATNNFGLEFSDVKKEKKTIEHKHPCSAGVTILSYARYCRYRAILRRLENVTDKWLKNAVVSAIGGFTSRTKNHRILFCHDEFYHPDLDDHQLRCDELAPNLKGRPRKKRLSLQKECSRESDEYESTSDTTTMTPPPVPNNIHMQKPGKRISALRNGYVINRDEISEDEQRFLLTLHKFMRIQNTPIGRIPSLGFKQIDLYYFYTIAQKIGGYEQITQKRMWKYLYDKLGGDPSSTSAATCTRRHYERLLLSYERYHKGEASRIPVTPIKFRRKRGRKKGTKMGLKNNGNQQTIQAKIKKKAKVTCMEYRKNFSESENANDKEMKWNEIRKQKAFERNKMRKTIVRKRTVKAILNCHKTPSKQDVTNRQAEETKPAEKIKIIGKKTLSKLKFESKEELGKSDNASKDIDQPVKSGVSTSAAVLQRQIQGPLVKSGVSTSACALQKEKQGTVIETNCSPAIQQQIPLQSVPQIPLQSVLQIPLQSVPQIPLQSVPQIPLQSVPQIPVQSVPNSDVAGLPLVPNSPAMFFPHPVYAMGGVYPFSLPVVPSYTIPVSPFVQQTGNAALHSPQPRDNVSKSVQLNTESSHSRPSVIQHTHFAVVSPPISQPGSVVMTIPHSQHNVPSYSPHNATPNMNTMKRSFPFTEQSNNISHDTHLAKDLSDKSSLSSHSFPRKVEDVLNPNKVLCKPLDMKVNQPTSPHLSAIIDQPTDLTMKTMRQLESTVNNNIVNKKSNFTISYELPQDLSMKCNAFAQEQKILPKTNISPSTDINCPNHMSPRFPQKTPLCSIAANNGVPSPIPSGNFSEKIVTSKAEKNYRAVTSPVDLSTPALHPAFPQSSFPQQTQQQYQPGVLQAMQIQQLYRAQMQARMAALEQLRQQNKMYLHHVPVKQQMYEKGGDLAQTK